MVLLALEHNYSSKMKDVAFLQGERSSTARRTLPGLGMTATNGQITDRV